MSSDSISDDMNKIVEPKTPTLSSKSFKFSCVEYSFMIVQIDSASSESLEFLVMIQQMASSASSFSDCLEFVSEFNIFLSARLNVCPPRHPRYIISQL